MMNQQRNRDTPINTQKRRQSATDQAFSSSSSLLSMTKDLCLDEPLRDGQHQQEAANNSAAVDVVQIEQYLNDTVLPTTTTTNNNSTSRSVRRSRRRRRSSSSRTTESNNNSRQQQQQQQGALTTESHPFFDGTLDALIRAAESNSDNDDHDTTTENILVSMDRLHFVDTPLRTTRRGGRRPRRTVGGAAARSA